MKISHSFFLAQVLILVATFFLTPQTLLAQKKNKKNKTPTITCPKYNFYSASALENLFLRYCSEGDTAKMSNLLSKGVNLNFIIGHPRVDSPSDIHFPLKNAIESYNIDAVRLLLSKGAEVQHCAYELDFFDRRKDFHYPTIDFVKVLGLTDNQTQAIFQKKIEYLKQVIELLHGKGFEIKDSFDEYFLYSMLNTLKNQDALDFYDYLVANGMKTDLRRYFKSSYFSGIIRTADTSFYAGVLKRGADINFYIDREVRGGVEQTFTYPPPLFLAIRNQSLFSVKWIHSHGGNINFWNESTSGTCSPLTEALKTKNKDVIKYIIESGADVNRVCNTGYSTIKQSPLALAMSLGLNDIVDLLVEKGAK